MELFKLILIYLALINLITFCFFGWDKYKAVHELWRIKEATLLGLCCFGGSVGGYLGMRVFHHKTLTPKFSIGVPLIFLIQIVFVGYLHFH